MKSVVYLTSLILPLLETNIHPFTHTFMQLEANTFVLDLGIRTHSITNWGQVWIQCLTHGHLDMWTGGAGDQQTELLVSGKPTLPPELLNYNEVHGVQFSFL